MAMRMRIGAQLGATGLRDVQRALQPLMAHRCAEVRGQRLREAVSIVLTGVHRLHRPTEQVQAQPGGEVALHLFVITVLRQRAHGQTVLRAQCRQSRVIQHRHRRLRETRTQPTLAALGTVAGKARLRPADHQQLLAARGGEVDQSFMAEVQRAELAHHQPPRSTLRQRHRPPWPRCASGAANGAGPPAR
ncbi:hypothetical protein QEK78_004215 [Stenotrophomonas maltophilia]